MSTVYIDNKGHIVQLGRRLGSGGEGDVFEIIGAHNAVAKVYKTSVTTAKAAKLTDMARQATAELCKFSAWPRATIHSRGSNETIGVIMPRVKDAREIHQLYSPAHRKVHFPHADWRFLIWAARNCAAAFSTLHKHGVVIGDVNQGNIFVTQNALVTIIDCDSFQFSQNGNTYLCHVGVPEFTPPELQTANFGQVARTTNHDCFGLAVLIFHLLFAGRHPYIGRFQGSGDMPVERAIREDRFAYGKSASQYQMIPPPHALTLDEVSPEVADLFERSFRIGQRPSADKWATALEHLENHLCKCVDDPGHFHFRQLNRCSWCRIEAQGGPNLFISVTVRAIVSQGGGIDVGKLWAEISSVPQPNYIQRLPRDVHNSVSANPLPEHVSSADNLKSLVGWVALFSLIVTVPAVAQAALQLLAIIAIAFSIVFSIWWIILDLTSPREQIRRERKVALTLARDEKNRIEKAYITAINRHEEKFNQKFSELKRIKDELELITADKDLKRQELEKQTHEQQLNDYLKKFYIHNASIPGIGSTRTAILESYGVETAYDVIQKGAEGIRHIPGFGGEVFGHRITNWAGIIKTKFHYNASQGLPPDVLQSLDAQYHQKRIQKERHLRHGSSSLKLITAAAKAEAERLDRMMIELEIKIAQAEADLLAID